MNEHILLVMKYLNDNDSVTQEELLDNCRAAVDAAHDAAADDAAAAAAAAADAYAAYAASATTVADDARYTKNAIDRYFNFAGENKQNYIDEITTNKGEE